MAAKKPRKPLRRRSSPPQAKERRLAKPIRAESAGRLKPAQATVRARLAAAQVTVVNMIPVSLSEETHQDSEPMIAVNPANPLQIAATAFTPDPMGGDKAPIYVSNDGGNTWLLNFIVPSSSDGGSATADISVAFGSASNELYAGIISVADQNPMEILRSGAPSAPTLMETVSARGNVDQPFANALTAGGTDRVYIGSNDFGASDGMTSTIDLSADGAGRNAKFNTVRLEKRATVGQNGPQVRPASHPDGTVYAAFYGWRAQTGDFNAGTLVVTADVVVVRDDHAADGSEPFGDLVDADGKPGMRVAQGVTLPFAVQGGPGQQRLGGNLSIAIDPAHSDSVYLAWAGNQNGLYTLHLCRSTDRGQSWSPDLLTIPGATNPALAINNNRKIALLYQQLTGVAQNQRWETHVQSSTDGASWQDLVMATTPAAAPVAQFDPYLGDYDHMVAVGTDFYGVFCSSNDPTLANFPNGVSYQRNHDFNNGRLLALDNATEVPVSIDPFFFKMSG